MVDEDDDAVLQPVFMRDCLAEIDDYDLRQWEKVYSLGVTYTANHGILTFATTTFKIVIMQNIIFICNHLNLTKLLSFKT